MANFRDFPLGLEVGAELCPRDDDGESEDCGCYLLGLDWHNWKGRDRQDRSMVEDDRLLEMNDHMT